MQRTIIIAGLAALAALSVAACKPKPGDTLSWAYPHAAKGGPLPQAPQGPQHAPGSNLTLSAAQVNDEKNPPDWFPGEHPPPPDIVAHGRPGGPTPCGECHLINGQGFLGAPNLAGLPSGYIVQQIQEFRSGRRQSWETGRPATQEMIGIATHVTDAEAVQAAAYFASLHRQPWVRVVESNTAPVTLPNYYGWLDLAPNGGSTPINGRIVEVPEDTARMMLEDPHSGVIDYAPVGSISRGEALVRGGGPAGQPCAGCHGADLKGMGDTPPLAGRAATYLARMLWDIKTGARRGPAVAAMQAPAAGLGEADIRDISAYLASRRP